VTALSVRELRGDWRNVMGVSRRDVIECHPQEHPAPLIWPERNALRRATARMLLSVVAGWSDLMNERLQRLVATFLRNHAPDATTGIRRVTCPPRD
jgi:hypothetical protein